ncbi:MAG: nuclear transport factor 2 family protein [Halioglobus sp.]
MNKTAGLPPSANQLADRIAIQDILNLHSRGLDRVDVDALTYAYWPDAEVDYGSFKGAAHDFAQLVLPILGETYELTRHSLSNHSVELQDNAALSETWVHAGHLLPGAEEELLFYGRYLDKLEKRDGRWKILHRTVVVDWIKRHAVIDERDSDAFSALQRGGHKDTDPLYTFLGFQ